MKKLTVFFLALTLLLCACGKPESEKAESFTIGAGVRQCYAMAGDTLISASGSGVRGFDLTGETVVLDFPCKLTYPAICSNGERAIAYDIGGGNIVCSDGSALSLENAITSVSLSDGGHLAVCAEEPGYKGAVTVYSPEMQPVYKWYCADSWIIAAAVSPDGEHLAVLCSAEDGCRIRMFSLDSETEQGTYPAPESLSELIWLDDTICGIGSSGIYFCSAEGREKDRYDFGELNFSRCCVWDGKLVAELRAHSSGGAGELVIIDDYAKERGRISCPDEIISLDCGDDGILCLTQSKVILYDSDYNEAFSADITGAEAAFLRQAGDIIAVGGGIARVIEY